MLKFRHDHMPPIARVRSDGKALTVHVRRHAERRHETAVSESALAAFDWPLRERDGSGDQGMHSSSSPVAV